jgi:RF-1 domain
MKLRDNFRRGYHRKIGRFVPFLLGFTYLTRTSIAAWSCRPFMMATTSTTRRIMTSWPSWRQCATTGTVAASTSSSFHCPDRRSFCCHTTFSPSQRRTAMAMSTSTTALFVAQPLCAFAHQGRRLRYRSHCSTATTFALNKEFSWFDSSTISRRPLAFARHDFTTLNSSGKGESDDDDDNDDDWVVPDKIHIPTDQLDISFVRSSGAGGQNVNKVSSCVQVRFHVASASWMPLEVRERFAALYSATINKDGVYWTECQEHRTQVANRHAVLQKLSRAVRAAWPRPKQRHLREGISDQGKRQRKQDKQFQKLKKEGRRRVDF